MAYGDRAYGASAYGDRAYGDRMYGDRAFGDDAECPVHSPGLRERKKTETRLAISRAAVRLALEHGPENVRVADIAAEADVSPRTYNNYFASIPEAICAAATDRALTLADDVRARPADEPLTEAIANAMLSTQQDDAFGKPFVRMIMHTPTLRGEFLKAIIARDAALARVIAERTGADPDGLYAPVLAAAISGVARVAGHRWLMDDNADFPTLLRSALAMVAPMVTPQGVTPESSTPESSTPEEDAPQGLPPEVSAERKIARPEPAPHTRLQATG